MTVRGSNFIRNSNFQLNTRADYFASTPTAVKPDGTGYQDTITVTGFTQSSNTPTVFASDTKQIQNGSLVYFGKDHAGFSGWAHRIYDLVPNTSFALQLPFDTLSPGSSYLLCYPIGTSQNGTTTWGPDGGWMKTQSLFWWADDFVVNRCPGSKRVLGMRKGSASTEYMTWTADAATLAALRGRATSAGIMVRQKVGVAGPRLLVDDGVTQAFSLPATGPTFTDANNNNYQFLPIDFRFSPNALKAAVSLAFDGAIGDICYMGGPPTLKYGSGITQDDLEQPQREIIDAYTHHNPDSLTSFQRSMPTTHIPTDPGLFAYCNLDLEALGMGVCHNSLSKVAAKIELLSAQPSLCLFAAALDPTGITSLVFGPQQATQVANFINVGAQWLPLRSSNGYLGNRVGVPGCFSLFSNYGGVPITATFDLDDAMA